MSQAKSPVVKDLGRETIKPQSPCGGRLRGQTRNPTMVGFKINKPGSKGFLQINRSRDSSIRRTRGSVQQRAREPIAQWRKIKKPGRPLQSSVVPMIGQTGLPIGYALVPLVTRDPAHPDDKLNRVIITGQEAAAE